MFFTKQLARRFPSSSVAILSALALSACSTTATDINLPVSTTQVAQTKGVVVIGVHGSVSASFRAGTLASDGSFEHQSSRATEFKSSGAQPYIVQAIEKTTTALKYGMFSASLGGKRYAFECGQVLPVLTVDSGAVQYYGDFEVLVDEEKLKVKQSFDIDRAQRFIDAQYPQSGWILQPGKLDRARSTECLSVPPAAIVG